LFKIVQTMWSRGETRGKNIPGSWNISQKRVTKGCTEGHHSFGLRVAVKSLPVEMKNVASLRDDMLRLERESGKKRHRKSEGGQTSRNQPSWE
jgi:hypothetical protein